MKKAELETRLFTIKSDARQMAASGGRSVEFQSAEQSTPELGLAFGFSLVDYDNYQLEFRVDSFSGPAAELAKKHIESANGQGRVLRFQCAESFDADAIDGRSSHRFYHENRGVICLGASVSEIDGGSGSIGLFVKKGDKLGFLTCAHVLDPWRSQSRRHSVVIHPGATENTNPELTDRIATVGPCILLRQNIPNLFDAGVAYFDEGAISPSGKQSPSPFRYLGNLIPQGLGAPAEGLRVAGVTEFNDPIDLGQLGDLHRLSRTTGHQRCRFASFLKRVDIPGRSGGTYMFPDVLEISSPDGAPVGSRGDSGGLYYDSRTINAVGMHFAAGVNFSENGEKLTNVGYACPIYLILKHWNLTLAE